MMMTPAPAVRSLIPTTLRCFITALALCSLLRPSSFSVAQEVPLVGRPTEDFYGAVGSGVKVAWQLDRTEVAEDEEIIATLVVTNVANAQQIARPDLKKLKDIEDRFVITDLPNPTPNEAASEVSFAYRLRPRNRQTDRLPTLVFYYFNPTAPVGKQFKLTNTGKAVPITVLAAKPKAPPPAVPLMEPEHLFAIHTGAALLAQDAARSALWRWVIVGLAGPLLAAIWFVAWRWRYPDSAKLARINRSHAARRALAAIHRAGRTPDPPASLTAAVLNYLRLRYSLPHGIATPFEVSAALATAAIPAADREAVSAFLHACDAARFAPTHADERSLAAMAEAVIGRLEAA